MSAPGHSGILSNSNFYRMLLRQHLLDVVPENRRIKSRRIRYGKLMHPKGRLRRR
jgi:hypothetical protein